MLYELNDRYSGLCILLDQLYWHNDINISDKIETNFYILENKPKRIIKTRDGYFWKPFKVKPRKRFLKKHIKKLAKNENKFRQND